MTRLAVPLLAAVVACGPARIAVTSQPAPTPTPSSSATPAPTRGAADAFVEIARAGASATYRITYLYRVVANAQTQTFESTWYVRPPEMRWDFTSPLGGTSSFYVLKGGVFVCSPAGQPSPSCFSLGSLAAAEQSSGAQVQELVREHPDRFTATAAASRDIGSTSAQCWDITDVSGEFGKGTMCYSAQGLPLFTTFSGPSGEFSMEAKSISMTVTDADLALPGPVQKAP